MIQHIRYTFSQSASAFVWCFAEARNPTLRNLRGYEIQSLRNATIESSLISLRALHDFFSPYPSGKRTARNDQDGDVRAVDYGYQTKGGFLSIADKTEINKRAAHICLRRLKSHTGWDFRSHMNPAINRMLDFLNYLRSDFLSLSDPELEAVISLQKSLSELVLVQFPDLGTQCNLRHD